jgi:2-amino-4-hydroxy-6-hydroxymethyldihydropteridine diphosphokinase
MTRIQNSVFLLLGGNLLDVKETMEKAKKKISVKIGEIKRQSPQYQSEAWGFTSDHPFINQVIELTTSFSAQKILNEILTIEVELGRIREEQAKGFSSRTIDIDMLYFNDEVISNENLVVPHYAIQDRLFTLLPLNDLIPNFVHPVLKKTNFELWQLCSDTNIPKRL